MGVLKINNGTASQSVSITSTDIAVSFLAWGSGTVRVTLGTDFKDVTISERKRYSAIFTAQTSGTKTLSLQSAQIIYVDDVQLENGNKASDFKNSDADLTARFDLINAEIADVEALKVDKPTTDGTWSLQKLGSVFTWVAGAVENIANTDLTNLSARIFTQGNTFTWNTAGFFHYLKGLLDKTGNGNYTKVVVVHPTTGEMVTRDFADPAATALAVQNANATQKTAMRTALLGTATPASPVLNNAFPSFIKTGEQTEIELIGLNLTLIDPTSIYIINPIDSSKIFALSYYNRTGLIITTVWNIPVTVPDGIYDIKIDLGVVAQGLSSAKLKVVSSVTNYNLLASQFVTRTKNNDPIIKTYAVSDNYIQLSGDVTGIAYPTPLDIEGVITVKTANILDGSKNWLIMADVMVPTYGAGTIEPLAPSFGVTQTTDAEFTSLSSIMNSISINGNAQNVFHNGSTGYNVSGTGSGGAAYYNVILEKTGQDVVFKMKRTLPGGVMDVMTKTLTGLINTSKMYALFMHEGGSNSHRKITNYTFLKVYQS